MSLPQGTFQLCDWQRASVEYTLFFLWLVEVLGDSGGIHPAFLGLFFLLHYWCREPVEGNLYFLRSCLFCYWWRLVLNKSCVLGFLLSGRLSRSIVGCLMGETLLKNILHLTGFSRHPNGKCSAQNYVLTKLCIIHSQEQRASSTMTPFILSVSPLILFSPCICSCKLGSSSTVLWLELYDMKMQRFSYFSISFSIHSSFLPPHTLFSFVLIV